MTRAVRLSPTKTNHVNLWGYCPRHKLALIGRARMCDECPLRAAPPAVTNDDHRPPLAEKPGPPACAHKFQEELVGGTLLTGHYVCRLCSHRVEMPDREVGERSTYPRQYQAHDEPVEADIHPDESETSDVSRFDQMKQTLTHLQRSWDLLRKGKAPVAALVRILPYGLGEAATAIEFLAMSLQ